MPEKEISLVAGTILVTKGNGFRLLIFIDKIESVRPSSFSYTGSVIKTCNNIYEVKETMNEVIEKIRNAKR